MTLYLFENHNKHYSIIKEDNYNFTIRESYLLGSEQKYKNPLGYYGTLEYALRKAFFLLDRDYINQNEFLASTPTYDPLFFKFKPQEIFENNIGKIREIINEVFEYEQR